MKSDTISLDLIFNTFTLFPFFSIFSNFYDFFDLQCQKIIESRHHFEMCFSRNQRLHPFLEINWIFLKFCARLYSLIFVVCEKIIIFDKNSSFSFSPANGCPDVIQEWAAKFLLCVQSWINKNVRKWIWNIFFFTPLLSTNLTRLLSYLHTPKQIFEKNQCQFKKKEK